MEAIIINISCRKYSQDSLDERIESKYQGAVLGDEGCIYHCLNETVFNWTKKCKEQNKSVRLLTPIVPERYMDELVKRIEELKNIVPLKVTFNDFGLLHRCKALIENEEIIPVLGRILTRSMIDCNWSKRLLSNEQDKVVEGLLDYSYMDNEKIRILDDYHIKEIEVNFHPERIEELKKVIKLPITSYPNHLLSVGRVCFSARYQQLKLPECVNCKGCRRKLEFSVNKKWSKRKMCYDEPDKEFIQYMKGLYVQGNIVYRCMDDLCAEPDSNVISEIILG
ncbi:MAG: hypothetical protein ACERKN_19260 [Velocimicrobium sp.]